MGGVTFVMRTPQHHSNGRGNERRGICGHGDCGRHEYLGNMCEQKIMGRIQGNTCEQQEARRCDGKDHVMTYLAVHPTDTTDFPHNRNDEPLQCTLVGMVNVNSKNAKRNETPPLPRRKA